MSISYCAVRLLNLTHNRDLIYHVIATSSERLTSPSRLCIPTRVPNSTVLQDVEPIILDHILNPQLVADFLHIL